MELPYYDETSQSITVAWATEFQDLESNVGKFASIELTGYLAGALAKISKSLVNNSDFNIVNEVINIMSESIALFVENELLNGLNDDNSKVEKCGCGGNVCHYTRIVGFFTPVDSWNKVRREWEFPRRRFTEISDVTLNK